MVQTFAPCPFVCVNDDGCYAVKNLTVEQKIKNLNFYSTLL